MPKLKEWIFAVPDGEIYPRMYAEGEEVTGSVAQAAKDQGKLVPEKAAPRGKAMRAPENKAAFK